MMNSLRVRLLLAYAGLILVGFIVIALVAGRQISAGTVQDFTNGLTDQAALVARALHEPMEHDASTAGLEEFLQNYAGQEEELALVLVDSRGRLLAASDPERVKNETVLTNALAGNINNDYDDTYAYAAAPIYEDGRLLGVVQLSAPLSGAQDLIIGRWLTLGGAVLVVTAVAGLAAFWLSTTLTRPLTQLHGAALQVAGGNFSARLPENRRDEIGQVTRAFNFMQARVAAMLAEQRAFASNASHELRTPLTNIRLRSEALREEKLDAETTQQYIAEIDDEARRMGDLVQDLLLLSRLDAGRLEAGREQIDAARLARQLLMEIKPAADARRIQLSLNAAPNLPPMTGALTHLQIVFRNLLTNGMKYTPDGGQISWQIDAGPDFVQHTIRDTGQGVAAEDLPHLFARFYRVDKSRSRAVPGVGLGLSLARTIVAFYGGEIRLHSAGLGMGTTVFVRWPVG